MKQVLRKIFSVIMAFTVLFSTFSFTISSHYCGEILVDSSIFSEAEDCGMLSSHDDSCDTDSSVKVCDDENMMHCQNIQKSVEGNDLEQLPLELSELPKIYFAVSFISTFQNSWIDKTQAVLNYKPYKPPTSEEDIIVLFENYRI